MFLVSTYYAGARARAQRRASRRRAIVAENSTAALAFGDRWPRAKTLHALRAKPSIDLACAYDGGGELFAEMHRDADAARCPDRGAGPMSTR